MRCATGEEGGAKLLTFDKSHVRTRRQRGHFDTDTTGTVLLFTGVQYRRGLDAGPGAPPHASKSPDRHLGA